MLPNEASGTWTDCALESEILRLRTNIQRWIEAKGLWHDCGFADFIDYVQAEPKAPVATVFFADGAMHQALDGRDDYELHEAFIRLLDELGYWFEMVGSDYIYIYPSDQTHADALEAYLHWKWVCSLIKEDTGDIYHELYEEFARHPDRLQQLGWREFEVLLFRIFQNQGFEPILGPGRGDDGIDLRLVQRAPLGDILTIVQAKRYAAHRKVGQTEVAALYGIGRLEGASNTLFVTSSSYAPISKRWAARTSGFVDLAEAKDVIDWCGQASHGIITDKSKLISASNVMKLIADVATRRKDRRLLHASGGWNITDNWFALVIKETRHAALILRVPKQVLDHDGYGQRGTHVPRLDASTMSHFGSDGVLRVNRSVDGDRVRYWDGDRLYTAWNGKPCGFDLCD